MKWINERGLKEPGMRKKKARRPGVLSCVLCALCLLVALAVPAPAKAAQSGQAEQTGKPYSYKIRIYAGRQGTVGGGEVLEYDSVAYGSRVIFSRNDVQLFDNSKYYVRGLRKSGVDNSEAQQSLSFEVTEDQDYVVAYGILGDAVSYVINYQDREGNTLAPSETYYGNVGDKPVIAYLYIEGYRPQAYNLTRTLSENAAENVFTFIYTPISEGGGGTPPAENQTQGGETENPGTTVTPGTPGAPGETGTVVLAPEAIAPVAPGGTTGPGGAAAPGGADAPGPGGADAPGPGGADAPGPGGADAPGPGGADAPVENVPDEEIPLDEGPEELVDLDDDEVPLANFFNLSSDARILGVPVAAIVVPGAVLIGCVIFLILKRKKSSGGNAE